MSQREWLGAVGGIFAVHDFSEPALSTRITPMDLINNARRGRQVPRKAKKDRSAIKAARKQRSKA